MWCSNSEHVYAYGVLLVPKLPDINIIIMKYAMHAPCDILKVVYFFWR